MKLKNKIAVGLTALALGSAVYLSRPASAARYSPKNYDEMLIQRCYEGIASGGDEDNDSYYWGINKEAKFMCFYNYKQKNYGGVLITGTKKYIADMKKALRLIRQNDPDKWKNVKENIANITLTGHSGVNVKNGRFNTSDYLGALKISHPGITVEWVAGSIVHEAWHVIYFKRGEPWRGREGEKKCTERQNEFYEKIGYPKIDIEKALKTEWWKVPYGKRRH